MAVPVKQRAVALLGAIQAVALMEEQQVAAMQRYAASFAV